MTNQKVIFITGMHRSGTSMFSGIFSQLGYTHGDNLLPPSQFNPLGYWEDADLVAFNDRLLEVAGMAWDSVRMIDHTQEMPDTWIPFMKDAKELIVKKMGNADGLVFKDPRLCILLSFWYSILDELAIPSQTILLFRNPEEVSSSLQRRNGFHKGKTDWLYWIYYVNALQLLPAGNAMLVYLKDITLYDEATLKEIAVFLSIELTLLLEAVTSPKVIQLDLIHRTADFEEKLPVKPSISEDVFDFLTRWKGILAEPLTQRQEMHQWKETAKHFQSVLAFLQQAFDENKFLSSVAHERLELIEQLRKTINKKG
jgi:hypothetical protein